VISVKNFGIESDGDFLRERLRVLSLQERARLRRRVGDRKSLPGIGEQVDQ